MADPVLRMHDLYHVDDRAVSRRNEFVSRGVVPASPAACASSGVHAIMIGSLTCVGLLDLLTRVR